MRKILSVACIALMMPFAANAGGLMTNTNYHIAFDRMMARGATTEIDAAYSNPAGLAWTHEGLQLSLNFQKPWQHRDIEATVGGFTQKYEGVASAPIVPALFASYKKDRLAVSAMIGIVGSGGFVKYDDGVPMFNVLASGLMGNARITPDQYKLSSEMKGKQYIFGGQVNVTYKILDCLSAAVGVRANYYDGYYRGFVRANEHPMLGDLLNMELDVNQRGWGFAPIVSVDFREGPLTLAARYEFRTKIDVPNTTNKLNAALGERFANVLEMGQPGSTQVIAATLDSKMTPYKDGVKTRYDMPALLAVAAGYEFTPQLRGTLEYHFFDDKNATMGNDRQKELTHGTHEFLAGLEYDINDKFTVSCGGQRTDYGLSDGYQLNTSFACDSWSVGLGGAVNLSDNLRLNAGYFITIYSDYNKTTTAARDGYDGQEIYSRTNNVIGIGLDYKF